MTSQDTISKIWSIVCENVANCCAHGGQRSCLAPHTFVEIMNCHLGASACLTKDDILALLQAAPGRSIASDWNAEFYTKNAGFVPKLGRHVVDILDPK